ncbi:MAG: sodium-dependent transporter [Halioglobus sp.]|nr:sodium-dependent transporter [Halioglobus sp.]
MPVNGEVGRWQTRTTFILALTASAVGLGNLWRFAYLSGEHGGAPFVIAYIVSLFLIAVPLLVAEVVLGKQGRAGPIHCIRRAADGSLRSRGWMLLGVLACFTGLLILTLYTVVAGWGLAYANFMYSGEFNAAAATVTGEYFSDFLTRPVDQAYWITLFLGGVSLFVMLGVRRGLGMLVWLAVPVLLAMLGFLVKFGLDQGDLRATREFLFAVRPEDFTMESCLVALGHALFTLGVGVGTGISYGAYSPERIPIARSIIAVAVFDTMIALLAGLAIFPIVFANNMEPASGPALLFISLPYAFGNMLQGEVFGAVFFLMMVVTVLGSAVAIMEPLVAALKQQVRVTRFTAVLIVGSVVWLLAGAVVASLEPNVDARWFGTWNLFAALDKATADTLLPLVALFTALFVGWQLREEVLKPHLDRESQIVFGLWRFLLRYVTPPAIIFLMLSRAVAV